MQKVSAVSCDSYEQKQVYLSVKDAIEKIGFQIPSHKWILIKPNIMSQNTAEQHTITHYSIIDALCRIFSENYNEIFIGESISFFQNGLTKKAFQTSGIQSVAEKYHAHLIEFEKEKLIKVSTDPENESDISELFLPEILLQVDLIVDACKLKTHNSMRFSGAIKNMFGCLPGGYKQKIHQWVNNEFELANVLIDIHKKIAPTLSIMDAVVGLDGGPTALGKPVHTGMIFASENPAALDFTAASMIGYEVNEIPLFLQALKRNMINVNEQIDVIGEYPSVTFHKLVRAGLNRPYNKNSIFVKHTYVNLNINQDFCNQCQKCIKPCPTRAIHLADNFVTIDTDQCINCYHCLFVCPQKAIKINPTPMNIIGWDLRKVLKL